MTRLEALKALASNVEAGTDAENHHAAAFQSESAYGHCTWHDSHKASGGSLDAAKALHEAVLPGYAVNLCYWPDEAQWQIALHGKDGKSGYEGSHPDIAARAWLLAILRGLIEQEEAQ